MKKINLNTTLNDLKRGTDYFESDRESFILISFSDEIVKQFNMKSGGYELSKIKLKRLDNDLSYVSIHDLIYGFGSY